MRWWTIKQTPAKKIDVYLLTPPTSIFSKYNDIKQEEKKQLLT